MSEQDDEQNAMNPKSIHQPQLAHGLFGMWYQLDRTLQLRSLRLLVMMLIGTSAEMLGIGVILPIVSIVVAEPVLTGTMADDVLRNTLPAVDQTQLVLVAMVVLVVIFAVKAMVQLVVAQSLAKFTFAVQEHLSQKLFTNYLRQPYAFHLARNSGHLINSATIEARDSATGVNTALTILAELAVAVGITLILVAVSPLPGLAIAVMVIAAASIILLQTRRAMTIWGAKVRHHHQQKIQLLQQGLAGIKLTLLMGRQQVMIDRYALHNSASAQAGGYHAAAQAAPRLLLELLAVTGMAALVVLLYWSGRQGVALVPLIGLYAAAAFRLIPSISRVVTGMQSLRYYGPTIGHVATELAATAAAVVDAHGDSSIDASCHFARDISLSRISFTYPNSAHTVIDDITISIAKGAIVGIVGPSGVGKTTMIDIMLGLLNPTSGRTLVDGIDIATCMPAWQRRIGYVPQDIVLIDDSLANNVALGMAEDQISHELMQRTIAMAQLEQFVATLPDGINTKIGERGVRLSGGQRQRIGIARALFHCPDLLVIDEGTNALDVATEAEVMSTILRLRGTVTIVVVSHRSSALAGCDSIVHLTDVGATVTRHRRTSARNRAKPVPDNRASLRTARKLNHSAE